MFKWISKSLSELFLLLCAMCHKHTVFACSSLNNFTTVAFSGSQIKSYELFLLELLLLELLTVCGCSALCVLSTIVFFYADVNSLKQESDSVAVLDNNCFLLFNIRWKFSGQVFNTRWKF